VGFRGGKIRQGRKQQQEMESSRLVGTQGHISPATEKLLREKRDGEVDVVSGESRPSCGEGDQKKWVALPCAPRS